MDKEDSVYINNEILLSHLKKSEIMPFAATRIGLEIITLSEVSQTKIWNLKNDIGDFPGGPVVKIPCIQCRGRRFDP